MALFLFTTFSGDTSPQKHDKDNIETCKKDAVMKFALGYISDRQTSKPKRQRLHNLCLCLYDAKLV